MTYIIHLDLINVDMLATQRIFEQITDKSFDAIDHHYLNRIRSLDIFLG